MLRARSGRAGLQRVAFAAPLAAAFAFALALALAGCGGKFTLPEETPGGEIPEKGSYAYQGSIRGFTELTDVLLTLGTGGTVYVVSDSVNVQAFPRFFRQSGLTPPLSYTFTGAHRPVKICQGPGVVYVLDHGDTTIAKSDTTWRAGFLRYGLTGGTPTAVVLDSAIADARGIASDPQGNVYVSCVAKEFVRDDPNDPRILNLRFVSRVYRYLAAQNFAKDTGFFVDDGQGVGTVSEPGDCFVLPVSGIGSGELYVADTGKDVVQRLTIQPNAGEPLPGIVLDGQQTGTAFTQPSDFVGDASGFMYVVDPPNRRVLRYSDTGTFVQKVNIELDLDADSLHLPIATSADDSLVYVADRQTGKVSYYKRRK
jgi:hypothetical protein